MVEFIWETSLGIGVSLLSAAKSCDSSEVDTLSVSVTINSDAHKSIEMSASNISLIILARILRLLTICELTTNFTSSSYVLTAYFYLLFTEDFMNMNEAHQSELPLLLPLGMAVPPDDTCVSIRKCIFNLSLVLTAFDTHFLIHRVF